MIKTLSIIAIILTLSACTMSVRQCPTGQTAVSLENGVLVYTPVMGLCPIPKSIGPNTSGVFADGHLPAPTPGSEWWNAF